MQPVNYDVVASSYDRRYERTRYDGVREVLHRFVEGARDGAVAEVGCGTGHWLADLSSHGFSLLLGVDTSWRMLEFARAAAPSARLVLGAAKQLPWTDRSVDRLFCVNAIHHFLAQREFLTECRRVLRPGGGLLTIGLDPHAGLDRWWVYDFFPNALIADRLRYPSTARLREWLTVAGFQPAVTEVAQTIDAEIPFSMAWQQGFVDRRATSQLLVIGEADYEAGMTRLMTEQPVLRSNVRLYATTAWV